MFECVNQQPVLSVDEQKAIDEILKKFPEDRKRSASLMALRVVQDTRGFLDQDGMDAVAAYLGEPPISIYEVATFYTMYRFQKMGRCRIKVCNSISCHLNGSEKIIEHLKKRLGIEIGETTEDGAFSLGEAECLAACVRAPMLQVNDYECFENLTTERIDELLEQWRKEFVQEVGA